MKAIEVEKVPCWKLLQTNCFLLEKYDKILIRKKKPMYNSRVKIIKILFYNKNTEKLFV